MIRFPSTLIAAALAAAAPGVRASDAPPQVVPVASQASAPKVDGDLAEWGADGWVTVQVRPALERKDRAKYGLEEEDDRNVTGTVAVQMKAVVVQGTLYLAVKYPDSTEDKEFQGWEWRGSRYLLARRFDDQFAVRFHLAGDYDRTMLSAKAYQVDVWHWSAARTNPTGFAHDTTHSFSTKITDDAAEYSLPGGKTVYIRKTTDAGVPPYVQVPAPKENKGERLPSFDTQKPQGSAGNVAAKGRWAAGHWSLEFARALSTGAPDDVAFKPGQKVLGQIAVFNRGTSEHKSVSEPLLFDFSAVR